MMNVVLFDLDGTLTDPGLGITNSVIYALDKFNIRDVDRAELYRFIGPPLKDSFMNFYGFSEADSLQAIEYYREYFKEYGIFENRVYDGIPELLDKLKGANKRVMLATSKPELFAIRILEHFDLLQYFDVVAGATMDGSRSTKADVIRYALSKGDVTDLSSTIMVGDREHDIFGAKECGMMSIGVLYGYGNREELETAGANYLVEFPQGILDIL